MNVQIKISHALKKYGNNTVIPDLSLDIKPGSFFTLLGPSGCGKTTLLRMIAGFNSIEGGDFYFNDKRINDLDPSKRNIGMVFQNYAIFPHMTVRKNVEFGLQNRNFPRNKIVEQASKYLKMMKIEENAERKPNKLSGGQQQRVALARALCIEPNVLLMDEPLSNLDAKLRVEMRTVIKEIQNAVGITTVYVTHDQEEAMAISDQIAVMNHGVIQQIGTPKSLYQRPKNLFVATFIGQTNVFNTHVMVHSNEKCLVFGNYKLPMSNLVESVRDNQDVRVSIRPEEFVIIPYNEDGIEATVEYSTFLGLNTHYIVKLNTSERVEIIQESQIDDIIADGTKIKLGIKAEKINVFDQSGTEALTV